MSPSQLESRLTMIAIDTNVLVRLVVRDDDVQARRAAALFEQNEIYVCKTVLLETEWVLRFSYELDEAAILDALKGVVGLPHVSVEDGLAVAEALDLLAAGMDFADALHVASSREAARFATFDKRLKKRADTAAPGRHVREA
jgi:predicted nucleic-acid-binding protein